MEKRVFWFLLAFSFIVVPVFAGGSRASSADMSELHIMIRNIGDATTNDNIIHRELERRTGLKLNFELRAGANYSEATATVIASGNYPDAMEFDLSYPVELQNMADDGILKPLDDLLTRYGPEFTPRVRPANTYFVSTTDNKTYGVASRNFDFGTNEVIAIQKNWLDRLGLQIPKTSDEYFNVLTAFEANAERLVGPNRRFVPHGSWSGKFEVTLLRYFMSENQMIDGWNWVDGRLVHTVNMPAYRNVLQTARRFYQAGLIEPEFPIMRSRDDALNRVLGNQYGAWDWYADSFDAESSTFALQLYTVLPEMRGNLAIVPYFQDVNGAFRFPQNITRRHMIIFAKTPDEKAVNIMRLLNFIASEEGFYLTELGLEGDHYTRDNSGRITVRELSIEERASLGSWNYTWIAKRSYIPIVASDYVRNFMLNELSPAYGIESPLSYGNAQSRHGSAVSQVLGQYRSQLITQPNINFDALFNEMVATWNSSGGAEITREQNERYGGRP